MRRYIVYLLIMLMLLTAVTSCATVKNKDVSGEPLTKPAVEEKNTKAAVNEAKKEDNPSPVELPSTTGVAQPEEVNISQEQNSNQEVQANAPVDKSPVSAVFNVKEDETFVYVNDAGNLMLRNFKDDSEEAVTENENIYDYDLNLKDGKVVYIARAKEESLDNIVVIYDILTRSREVIDSEEPARIVRWSPNYKYIAVDYGTGSLGATKVYDINTKKWVRVTEGATMGFEWSPDGNSISIGISETVNPPTPVEDGDSISAAVVQMVKDSDTEILMQGTSNFLCQPVAWIDNNTIAIEKWIVQGEGEGTSQYYKADINTGELTEIDPKEIPSGQEPLNIPEEVSNVIYDVSPDRNRVLYTLYDEKDKKLKVMVWDIPKQQRAEICPGSEARWIKNK